MNQRDVLNLYNQIEALDIQVWLDGGWSVDALLGKQTRVHSDMDIVIQQRDVPTLRAFLERDGYHDVPRDDTSAWNFVMGDDAGRLVDIHAVVIDADGNGLYGPPDMGIMYPAASLTGRGTIAKQSVNCISPAYMVKFHTGYTLRASDFHDVAALCERFGIEYPAEYAALKK